VVEYTRSIFPLSNRREDTIIAGVSMGGYGAIRNGLKYNDTFGHIVGISPALVYDGAGAAPEGSGSGIHRGYFEMVFGDLSKVMESDMNPAVLARKILDTGGSVPNLYFATGWNDMLVFTAESSTRSLRPWVSRIFTRKAPAPTKARFSSPTCWRTRALRAGKKAEFRNPFWVDAQEK
jgi:S-formylglutathione hydrolase FrmB